MERKRKRSISKQKRKCTTNNKKKKKRKKSNQVKEKVLTNSEVTGIFIHIAIKLSGKKWSEFDEKKAYRKTDISIIISS